MKEEEEEAQEKLRCQKHGGRLVATTLFSSRLCVFRDYLFDKFIRRCDVRRPEQKHTQLDTPGRKTSAPIKVSSCVQRRGDYGNFNP